VTAPLALSVPPFLRMALNDLCDHATVSAQIFYSTGAQAAAANPAAKSAPEARNQQIHCSAPCLPANGNRLPPAPGLFVLAREVPADFLS